MQSHKLRAVKYDVRRVTLSPMNESARVPADLDAETRVYCLKCGYDLTPIPKGQCSECGYGYDHEAIRRIASEYTLDRLGSYKAGLRFSIISAICASLVIAQSEWKEFVGWGYTMLFLMVMLDLHGAAVSRFRGGGSHRAGGRLFGAGLIALVGIGLQMPGLLLVGVTAGAVLAGLAGMNRPHEYPYLEHSVSVALSRKLTWMRRAYFVMIFLAIFIGLIAIVL